MVCSRHIHEKDCFFMEAWVLTQKLRHPSDQLSKCVTEQML